MFTMLMTQIGNLCNLSLNKESGNESMHLVIKFDDLLLKNFSKIL